MADTRFPLLRRANALVRRLCDSRGIPIAVGIVLLLAATLKGHELATQSLDEQSVWSSRPWMIGLVLFEVAFGLWLLSGLHAHGTRVLALLTFLAFFQVVLYQAASWEPSCRCLGKASPSPWFMIFLDGMIVLALLAWRPRGDSPTIWSHPHVAASTALVYLLVGIPAALNMVYYTSTGIRHKLRQDPRLNVSLRLALTNPAMQDVLDRLQAATGLEIRMEDRLAQTQIAPNLGEINAEKAHAWAIMELLADQQSVPARWKKVPGGYVLVRNAPLGGVTPWLVSGFVFVAIVAGLMIVRGYAGSKRSPISATISPRA